MLYPSALSEVRSRRARAPFHTAWLPLAVILLAVAALAACRPSVTNPDGTPRKLRVVATTSIHADLTRQVAGDAAEVISLLPAGVDPHDFEPSAADVEKVAQADVIVINGLDLEAWFGRLKANAGGNAKVITMSTGIKTRKADPRGPSKNDHGHDGHDHDADPHIWQSPVNAKKMVETVRNGLMTADKANANAYLERAKAYLRELDDLHAWIKAQIETIPPERRKVVTNHEAFGYYLDEYGLKFVGSVLPASGAGAEPSAQEIAELVRKVREQNVPAIFTENTFNAKLADQLARDAGVKVVTSLYSDALGPPGSGADTYIGMMRANTEAIVQALK